MTESSTEGAAIARRPRLTEEPAAPRGGVSAATAGVTEWRVFGLPLAASAIGAIVGFGALVSNAVDACSIPALALLGLSVLVALGYARMRTGILDRAGLVLAALCLSGAGLLLVVVPQWMYGSNVNGIVNHSVVSIPLLLLLSTAAGAHSIRSLMGSSPSGQDFSLYPWLLLPVALALLAYGLLLGYIVVKGIGGLNLDLVTTAYHYIPGTRGGVAINLGSLGFLNNILGTFLLMAMTLLIAMLPGVGAGVFMSEYPGRLAGLIDFCTQMLRAVSLFVIGAAALALILGMNNWAPGSILSQLIRGTYSDALGLHADNGSFLFAAVILAMLVMPVIGKMTEEGLRSVPREIREGSIALGATDAHGLRRVLLPWAAPNILTGLLLAAAEVNGSLAVIMFFAGVGDHGLGPTSGVTSLDYVVFATVYGPVPAYRNSMGPHQFTAALLLLAITMGLTVAAMLLQRRFAKRYRGSLTSH